MPETGRPRGDPRKSPGVNRRLSTANVPARPRGWRGLVGRLSRRVREAARPPAAGRVRTEPIEGDGQRYLDPRVLSQFGLTPLIARRVVEGFLTGLHRSPFRGFSVEFADHREYVPGDDIKFIDWLVFGRTDHLYVKRSEEETNLRCFLLLDRSASMAFGTEGLTKWDYACFLSSCLAYLMLKQQDAVGLALLGGPQGVLVPARCRSLHLHQLMTVMIQNPPAGGVDLAGSLRKTVRLLKRRSLIVVVSDLIDDPEPTVQAIRLLRSHKHDVVVFHIQDPAEITFDFDGASLFRDLETGEELEVDPAVVRDDYRRKMADLQEFWIRQLREAGIDYVPIDIHQPYDQALAAYLKRRAERRG